ncbi:MAG: hypothetical protein MI810_06870 [Flavobacteriales bacterium]|nr:hypothetical protein [Flavobacteriales bacterium]
MPTLFFYLSIVLALVNIILLILTTVRKQISVGGLVAVILFAALLPSLIALVIDTSSSGYGSDVGRKIATSSYIYFADMLIVFLFLMKQSQKDRF